MSKYSYVTVNLQSHGYMVRTNEGFEFDGVNYGNSNVLHDLIVCSYSSETHHPNNVRIRLEDIGKLVMDRRATGPGSFVLVYRAGKTKDEVFFILRPQLRKLLRTHLKAYQQLAINVKQMMAAPLVDDFLCKGKDHV